MVLLCGRVIAIITYIYIIEQVELSQSSNLGWQHMPSGGPFLVTIGVVIFLTSA